MAPLVFNGSWNKLRAIESYNNIRSEIVEIQGREIIYTDNYGLVKSRHKSSKCDRIYDIHWNGAILLCCIQTAKIKFILTRLFINMPIGNLYNFIASEGFFDKFYFAIKFKYECKK